MHPLKKLIAILLAGLLFFNWYGYRLLFAYWQQHNNRLVELRLDNNDFDQSALISVKVPASHLAYYNNSSAFERVDGVIKVGNITYRYVKRRIFSDSIELLCIPDARSTNLRQTLGELAGRLNNQHSFPGGKTLTFPGFEKVYAPAALHFLLRSIDHGDILAAVFPASPLSFGHDRPAERPPAGFRCSC